MDVSMLTNCELIALSDAFVVQDLVESGGRKSATLVSLVPRDQYLQELQSNKKLARYDSLLRSCYEDAQKSKIQFEHDKYDGYELVNRKETSLSKGEYLHECRGYMGRIPPSKELSINPISIIDETEYCKAKRVLVGAVRFANHSCVPNCQFLATEHNGRKCVKLTVIRSCRPGEALTVDYGPPYFDLNNRSCNSDFTDRHGALSGSLDSVEEASGTTPLCRLIVLKDRPDVRYQNRKLNFNVARKQVKKKKPKKNEYRSCVSVTADDTETEDSESNCSSTPDLCFFISSPKFPKLDRDQMSVPNVSTIAPDSVEDVFDVEEQALSELLDHEQDVPRTLHPSSDVTLDNFLLAADLIIAKHGTSDVEANEWFSLIKKSFPFSRCPSFKVQKRRYQKLRLQRTILKGKEENGDWTTLDFTEEIREVVQEHIELVWEYEVGRDNKLDLKIPDCFSLEMNELRIFLILNSDGVRLVKSDGTSIWLVWLGVANLPPTIRCAFENIILASLWFGSKKPTWNSIFEVFLNPLSSFSCFLFLLNVICCRKSRLNSQPKKFVEFGGRKFLLVMEIIFLVADLPAKASLLAMAQYNAFYGCTLCYTLARRSGRTHYYPNVDSEMRDPGHHLKIVSAIEDGVQVDTFGVKSRSKLFELISNLPLTAPIDYMHQVLLGVTRVLLQISQSRLGRSLTEANKVALSVKLPKEFKRPVRGLDKLPHFKATEFKVWLLYVGPVVLRNVLEDGLYARFMIFSFAIRLFLISSEFATAGGNLMKRFLDETQNEHGEECFSANIHSLSHLAWQVEMFDPLWSTSAVMFESANYLLKKTFSGSVNHMDLLVERYIRNKVSRKKRIADASISHWVSSLRGKSNFERNYAKLNPHLRMYLPPLAGKIFVNTKTEFHTIEASNNESNVNSFVTVYCDEELVAGEMLIFFESSPEDQLLLRVYRCEKLYRCIDANEDLPAAFFEARATEDVRQYSMSQIDEKLVKLQIDDRIYFVSLLKHFEHD